MLKLTKPTAKDKQLLNGLAQLYAYDFSAMSEATIGSDGLFPAMRCFDEIWTDPDRHAHLIKMDAEPAGFAIVRRTGKDVFDMEQFFVLRKFRRRGVGRDAAQLLFRSFPGQWTVEQITANTGAQIFWRTVIAEYTKGRFDDTSGENPVQSFVS